MENRKARAARLPSVVRASGRTGPTTGRNAKRGHPSFVRASTEGGRYLGEGFQFALEAYGWVVFVADNYEIVFEMQAAAAFELGAGNPLAADERGFGYVFDGLAVPGDGADDGVVVGGEYRVANGGGGIDVLGAFENV